MRSQYVSNRVCRLILLRQIVYLEHHNIRNCNAADLLQASDAHHTKCSAKQRCAEQTGRTREANDAQMHLTPSRLQRHVIPNGDRLYATIAGLHDDLTHAGITSTAQLEL